MKQFQYTITRDHGICCRSAAAQPRRERPDENRLWTAREWIGGNKA